MQVRWDPLTSNVQLQAESTEDRLTLRDMVGQRGQVFLISHVDEGCVDESSPSEVRAIRMARNPA